MIEIIVRNKVAKLVEPFIAICGNSDYGIRFNFDEEWDAYETKTARFKWNSTYVDMMFIGNECPMPVINDAYGVEIGVYAGNLHTTTGAYLPMKKSILCGDGAPADPTPDVYSQIMEKLNGLSEVGQEMAVAAKTAATAAGDSAASAQESASYNASCATAAANAENSARIAAEQAQAMAGTFDFTGYLRYQIVDGAPETYDVGVLYIVTET